MAQNSSSVVTVVRALAECAADGGPLQWIVLSNIIAAY